MTISKLSCWLPKSLRPSKAKSTTSVRRSRLSLLPLEAREVPAAGLLDHTFVGNGPPTALTLDFGVDENASAVLVRPDGRTVIVGTIVGGNNDFVLAQYNADGTPDTTFDTDGKNTYTLGATDVATSAALQPDGRLIVAGYTTVGGTNDFAVIRVNADGSLDNTFNGNTGKAVVNIGADDRANAVAIQQDGKIVVAGSFDGGLSDFAVVRLNADGTTDTTFSGDGKQNFTFGPSGFGFQEFATGVAVQKDGKIVVGGYAKLTNGGDNDFAVARLNTDGSLDATFGTGGKFTTDIAGATDDKANAVLIRPDGKIVLVGVGDTVPIDFAAVQLNPNGTLDPSFAGDGKGSYSLGSADVGTAAALSADGGLIVAGYSNAGGTNDLIAIKLDAAGVKDTSFGTNGTARRDFGFDDRATGVAVRADGKIVVAGYTAAGANPNNIAATVFSATGQPVTFGNGTGKVTTNFGSIDTVRGVLVQPDGKIVAVGPYDGGLSEFGIARYSADGTLDTTFDTDGKVNFTFGPGGGFGFQDFATAAALQADGKIVVVGYANQTNGGTYDFAVARLNTDGSLDTTFGVAGTGKVTVDLSGTGSDDKANAVAIDPVSGRIVVAGTRLFSGTDTDFIAVALDKNGKLDTTFNSTGIRRVGYDLAGGNEDGATAVAIQPDGKIVLGGYAETAAGAFDYAAVRLNANGTSDATFAAGGLGQGRLTVDFGPSTPSDKSNAVVLRPDGKIVFAGTGDTNPIDFTLAQFKADGTLDPTFGGDGKVRFTLGGTDVATSVALQPDGRLVVAGYSNAGGTNNFSVIRVNADGSKDTSFAGALGTAVVDFGGDDRAYGVAVEPDGRIIVAGTSGSDFALARLEGDAVGLKATVTNNTSVVAAGKPVSYTVVFSNAGPDRVTAAAAAIVNLGFGVPGATYTSVAANGATGNTAAGNFGLGINEALTLPAGASVTYTITGTVPLNATGTESILASIIPPTGVYEYDGTNNFASVADPIDAAPTATAVADQLIPANGTTGAQAFTVGDDVTAAGSLVLSGGSSNPALVPNANIVFGGTGANRTVTVTPAAGQSGTATITLAIDDGVSAGKTITFVVTVNAAPTVSDVANQTNTGGAFGPLAFTVNDAETAAAALTVTGVSSNQALVPNANIVIGGTGANRTVTVTPVTGQLGTATIILTVTDANGATVTDTFDVVVNPVPPVNQAPTVSDVANQSSTGSAVGPLAVTVGDAETAAGALTVTAVSSNPALIPNANITLGGSGANRTLTLTSVAGQAGTATVTITVTDANGATATDTFTVTVTPVVVNAFPTISGVANQTGTGAAVGPLAVTVGDAETPAAALTVTATSSNPALVPNGNIVLGGSGANRTVTATPVAGQSGTATITLTVTDANGAAATTSFTITVTPVVKPPVGFVTPKEYAVGSDVGGTGEARFYNPDGTLRFIVSPFGTFSGGVRTAAADFNGDGVADLVVGTGPGRATQVRVLDGVTKADLFSVDPFEAAFTGGVYVTAGDLNGDGKPDLVITPDEGGGPRVDVYDGASFGKSASFFGIDDPNFRGGARAAVGDVNGDGTGDLIVAAGFGGGPRVAGFDGKSLGGPRIRLFGDFYAFEQTLRNGVFITAGDLDGDGKAEVIAGGGPGGGPRVLALNGADLMDGNKTTTAANFFGGNTDGRGGIRLAVKDLDGDNRADLVVGSGAGAGSRVTAYRGKDIAAAGTPAATLDYDAFPAFTGGVFVG